MRSLVRSGRGRLRGRRSMGLAFSKYEGTANDFVVVDRSALGGIELTDAEVAALCDRHRGIGGDGVLLVSPSGTEPDGTQRFAMRVINADGSIPEMCGNGLRCVVAHLVRGGRAPLGALVVDTDAGPHRCVVSEVDGELLVEVEMRVPSLVPNEVPVLADAPLRDADFEVEGTRLHVTAVSMGNPHAVVFDEVGPARASLGPAVARDPRFPASVNVGFARSSGEGLELFVFERGAGWTEACGTGACAAAVAAVETGRIPRGTTVPVRLPGGVLAITVGQPGEPVRMKGPARFVFEGTIARPVGRA